MRQNSVQISGFVCKPEIHQFTSSAVCRFNLGINRYEKKGEQTITHTAYIPVEIWKASAADLESIVKGAKIQLNGWLKADSYTDGESQTRSRLIIAASAYSIIEKETNDRGE